MENRFGGWVLLVGFLAVGCFPSRATLSANEIGCSSDDVAISEAPVREGGVLENTEHWEAQCHGRIYYCSQGGTDRYLLASQHDPLALVVSDQVICQEVAESPQESANREAYQDAKARTMARERQGAPAGAAGFEFGLSSEESQKRCEAAGYEWTSVAEGGNCSGPAAKLGMAVDVDLAFCGGRTCGITIEHRPSDRWATRAVRLKSQLESKYGPAQNTSGRIPETCRSEDSFSQCLKTGSLQLSYAWQWSSGETLELSIGKPTKAEEPAIRLLYSRPRSAGNLSNL
ncbi:MAG TPA: hypothetical protein VHB79_06845 [Polyangiaceae bacterium]|nr:hypothetical protein [Polyangiaceae bacterium]